MELCRSIHKNQKSKKQRNMFSSVKNVGYLLLINTILVIAVIVMLRRQSATTVVAE
jgi:cell division protein FtsL